MMNWEGGVSDCVLSELTAPYFRHTADTISDYGAADRSW
jgi:hypothetical protein